MDKLLPEMMKVAVFLQIEILQARGGPTTTDMKKVQETSDMLGEHGDILICGGGQKGQQATLFNRTAHAFAVLAFCPGGVEVFGTSFEAKRNGDQQEHKDGGRTETSKTETTAL